MALSIQVIFLIALFGKNISLFKSFDTSVCQGDMLDCNEFSYRAVLQQKVEEQAFVDILLFHLVSILEEYTYFLFQEWLQSILK